MLNRSIPPDSFDIENFMISKPTIETLKNGVKVFRFFNPLLDLIHIQIQIKGGTIFENKKTLASSCFQLLKESSKSKTGSEMDEILDFYGASWHVTTSLEMVSIKWIIPQSNCEVLIPILFDILANPEFKSDNLERQKQKKIKDLEYNLLKYSYKANQIMFNTLFEENAPVGSILTNEQILDISTIDLYDYYAKVFNSSNLNIFIAGNTTTSIENQIYSLFNQVPAGSNMEPVSSLKLIHKPTLIKDPQTDPIQSSIIVCKKGIPYLDEDRGEFTILATLLGGYFGSRLMQNLREKNGFTYGVQCGSIYWRNESMFIIESDVTSEKTEESIEQIYFEMDRLKKELTSDEELKLVKRYLQGILLREMDGVVSFMKKYIFLHSFGLNESEIDVTLKTIHQVNSDLILKNANKHLQNEDFYTIIVGC